MDFKVSTFLILVVSFLIFTAQVSYPSQTKKQKLKFCSVDNSLSFEWGKPSTCPLLQTDVYHPIDCILARDRVTCLRHLLNNEADFMVAQPEDLLVLAMNKNFSDKILVTNKVIRQVLKKNETARYTMGIIAHKNITSLWQIENKRFCSPGFYPDSLTQNFVKYLESRIIPPTCDPDKTLLENRMSDLSKYFKSSCVSGAWTMNDNFDFQLKKNYSNVYSCINQPNMPNVFSGSIFSGKMDAMYCFLSDRGDLAWIALESAQDCFTEQEYEGHYLCPDGTTRPLNHTGVPCGWLKIPWETIITKADAANEVMQFIKNDSNDLDVKMLFMTMPIELEKFKTPADYLQEEFPDYYTTKDYHKKCNTQNRRVKWCVVTELETEKCKWLSFSAQAHGVEPLIECVQEISKEKCLKTVKYGWTDIFAIKPNLLSEAKKKGLKPLLHMVGNQTMGRNETAVLVRRSSKINSFEDMKKVRACFGEYADHAWNSFIYIMRNVTGDKDWYCKDKKMVSDYFEESCFANNLYSLCPNGSNEAASEFGKTTSNCSLVTNRVRGQFYKKESYHEVCDSIDEAIIRCMVDYNADVGFVNLSSIMDKHLADKSNSLGFARFLCDDQPIKIPIEESKACFASWRNYGSLMVHENLTETRKNEIYLLVLELDRLFNVNLEGVHKQISLHGPFGGQRDVIFSTDTVTLETKDCTRRCTWDYSEIYKHVSTIKETCDGMSPSESPSRIQFTMNLFLLNLFLIILTIILST